MCIVYSIHSVWFLDQYLLMSCVLLQVSAAESDFLGFSLSIVVIFGLSFLAASFILYPVAEKASKVSILLSNLVPRRLLSIFAG